MIGHWEVSIGLICKYNGSAMKVCLNHTLEYECTLASTDGLEKLAHKKY